jgi:hypothetical protein
VTIFTVNCERKRIFRHFPVRRQTRLLCGNLFPPKSDRFFHPTQFEIDSCSLKQTIVNKCCLYLPSVTDFFVIFSKDLAFSTLIMAKKTVSAVSSGLCFF